jgi:hypothetical protein
MSTDLLEHVQRLLSSDIHGDPSVISNTVNLRNVEPVGDHGCQ